MHKLRHFYYQNKSKIWKTILFVVFILGIIYLINSLLEGSESSEPSISLNNNTYYNNITNAYISNSSAISGEEISSQEASKIDTIIGTFLQYCKNGDADKAYEMLTLNCKEERYDTVEKFKENYLKEKFSNNKTFKIKNWANDTYEIIITEDILSTGDINNKEIIEYITIENENGKNKLNINNYVGKKEINKEQTQNNIKITVKSKQIYMDYEVYTFEIENNTNKTIKIDSLEETGTIYLEDMDGKTYKAYMHELVEEELIINTKRSFEISIKFANTYPPRSDINRIVFENLIIDYDDYSKNQNSENNVIEFIINL